MEGFYITLFILGILGVFLLFFAVFVGLGSKSLTKEYIKDNESFEQTETIALLNREIGELKEVSHELMAKLQDMTGEKDSLTVTLAEEVEKSRKILSQKKSSEVRLGNISEHLAPFLDECPHDPKNMSFLGNPIDFLVFDYDAGEIIFLEIKSGNSQESKRQKLIKNIIKEGKIYYEKMQISDKAVKHKREDNNE